jgi:hypothetical protein
MWHGKRDGLGNAGLDHGDILFVLQIEKELQEPKVFRILFVVIFSLQLF